MSIETRDDGYDRKYVKVIEDHNKPVTLDDEMAQAGTMPKADLWEECAVALVAETETHDILLWTAAYILHGRDRGVWLEPDCREHDLLLVAVHKADRGRMTDNNFARYGWHPRHLPSDALRIERAADSVVWRIEEQQFICKPPVWQVKGGAAGVELDLTYRQSGKSFWTWGPFERAPSADRGGYDLYASVDGTITAGGQRFEVRNGYGIREHIVTGQGNDPIRNLPAPRMMYWLYTMKDDIGINFFRPGIVDIATVCIGERQINFNPAAGKGQISYQTLEHWPDPRSGFNLPVRWHLNMSSEDVVVDFDIKAHGRGYFHWTVKDGVRKYCYLLCTCDGFVFDPKSGRRVEFRDHVMCNSFNRTIFNAYETLDGPLFPG